MSPPPPSAPVFLRAAVPWLLLLWFLTPPDGRAGEVVGENAGERGPDAVYTLEDCVRLARVGSPEAQAAIQGMEAARAGVTTAKAGFLPTVGAAGTYLKRDGDVARGVSASESRRAEDYTVTGRVTQNVFSSGRVRAQVDIAKRTLAVQEMAVRTTLEAVTLATRIAFFQVLQAEANIGVRRQAVNLLVQQASDEENRFKAGQSSQVNLQRVQVNLANERPTLYEAEADLVTAYVALAQAMGVPFRPGAARAPFRVRGNLEGAPAPPSLAACLVRAENQRPDLASRRLELVNADRQTTVEKSATRPRVDVFAGYDVFSEPSVLAERDYYSGYIVGLQASWQIFDGFATLGRVRANRARVVAASETLKQTRIQVQGEVRTAYEAIQQAQGILRSQGNNVALAQETLGLVTTNLGVGLGSQLELLQSRLDLTRTRSVRVATLFALRVAHARLDRAMGETAPASLPVPGVGGAAAGKPLAK